MMKQLILQKLADQGIEAVSGKGGFFLRGEGWISYATARKRTGVAPTKRVPSRRVTAWGDYAIVEMINRRRNA